MLTKPNLYYKLPNIDEIKAVQEIVFKPRYYGYIETEKERRNKEYEKHATARKVD